jgi:SagB-type dehydrogenase family enzyme
LNDLTALERVFQYHDGTKHHFNRFAPSLGYLDWASQPRPFRSFDGAPVLRLYPAPDVPGPSIELPRVTYDRLFRESAIPPAPVTAATIGHFLRCSLGLSAWKVFKGSRWSLRVNPSSGNLHPTEAYVIAGPLGVDNVDQTSGVWHYASDRHVIERRSAFDRDVWDLAGGNMATEAFVVALTSIHWRESWKYGERAFRYCQHDLGHAIAALGLSASMCGWRLTMLPAWSQRAVGALIGVDRDEDYVEAEREEPACALLVTRGLFPGPSNREVRIKPDRFLDAARRGHWFGRASQLSEDHVAWTFIDDVARATEDPGRPEIEERRDIKGRLGHPNAAAALGSPASGRPRQGRNDSAIPAFDVERGFDARALILQRRSAVALDGASFTDRAQFLRMLSRVMPGPGAPWDAVWWSPRIHFALFVHRVTDVVPGLYVLARAASAVPRLKAAFSREFAWTPVAEGFPLWLLQAGDYRSRSQRVSCDQEIAADGFFSLGMIADFAGSLAEHGPSFYRHLFWESGIVGQVLYLEAEAAGARATGIGCFYDDAVHDLLGAGMPGMNIGHAFQSLYHFTVGMPVEDARLTTEPGYSWERSQALGSRL